PLSSLARDARQRALPSFPTRRSSDLLHRKDLPGRPDLVLPKFRLAVFVHGCFWHRHPGCFYATSPSTRTDFWAAKLNGNVARDRSEEHTSELQSRENLVCRLLPEKKK